jgi:hypothetical protein
VSYRSTVKPEVGGQEAMCIAIENNHMDIVKRLLAHPRVKPGNPANEVYLVLYTGDCH